MTRGSLEQAILLLLREKTPARILITMDAESARALATDLRFADRHNAPDDQYRKVTIEANNA